MAGPSLAMFQSNNFLMSSVHAENSCQCSRGTPSSAQMIGVGYRRAISATTSHFPLAAIGSTSSVMTSSMSVRSRSAPRGVNAFETSRRSRWCVSPCNPRMLRLALSQTGPDVMPCAAITGFTAGRTGGRALRGGPTRSSDLGPVRSYRQRPLLACVCDDAVRLVGVVEVVVGDRWQSRFRRCRADACCHGPTIARREAQTIRYKS